MQASLVEAEERRAAEMPLEQKPANEILEAFPESEMLLALSATLGGEGVLELIGEDENPLKAKLVDFVVMEQRCKKWYSCSKGYFAEVAEQAQSQLAGGSGNDSGGTGEHSGADKAAPAAVDDELPSDSDAQPPPSSPSTALLSFIETTLTVLKEAVFALPENEDAAVPPIFAPFIQQAHEEVVLLDE